MVRIKRGALGRGLPRQDLTVTADHGKVMDDLVINASALLNGGSVDWVPMEELEDIFAIYHVETENHDLILANGAPSETFLGVATQRSFDTYQQYLDLYGGERIIPDMPMPRILSARLLPQSIRTVLSHSKPLAPMYQLHAWK
jgi:hypothetical protein